MGFLKKLFGGGASVEGLRKAVEQKRFADAKVMADQLLEQEALTGQAEVEQLHAVAGDGLARLNLDEALGFQRAGDSTRAEEHLDLAMAQVCGTELRREIEAAMANTPVVPAVAESEEQPGGGSCASCGPQVMEMAHSPMPKRLTITNCPGLCVSGCSNSRRKYFSRAVSSRTSAMRATCGR